MQITYFTFGPFQENTYLVWDDEQTAAVIDPGCFTPQECAQLKSEIESRNLNLKYHLLTHAHIDHVVGCQFIVDEYGLLPFMSELSQSIYHAAPMQGRMFGLESFSLPEVGAIYNLDIPLVIGQLEFQMRHTPGHAPGHIVMYHEASSQLIGGDMLFRGSIGRTDLPGASPEDMRVSLRDQILTLPDDTVVWSGHGPKTSVGAERQSNPFLQGL